LSWLDRVVDYVKLSTRYLFGIGLAVGALLFAPAWFVERLGLGGFLAAHRLWVGAAYLLVTSLLIAHGLAEGVPAGRGWGRLWRNA
jgi:hypothetical protein